MPAAPPLAPASPPDVRQGYALPVEPLFIEGSALRLDGPKAEPGAQPQIYLTSVTARHSLASHRAAKPERRTANRIGAHFRHETVG